MIRRQGVRALARSRGYFETVVVGSGMGWEAGADNGIDVHHDAPITVYAPTRRAAEAGLRAALEAMPVKRKGER